MNPIDCSLTVFLLSFTPIYYTPKDKVNLTVGDKLHGGAMIHDTHVGDVGHGGKITLRGGLCCIRDLSQP
jgi:hypothetical protein